MPGYSATSAWYLASVSNVSRNHGDEDDHDEAGSAGRVRADDPDRRAIVRVGPRWITGGPLSAPPNLSDPPGRQSGRAAEYGYGTLGGK